MTIVLPGSLTMASQSRQPHHDAVAAGKSGCDDPPHVLVLRRTWGEGGLLERNPAKAVGKGQLLERSLPKTLHNTLYNIYTS